MPQEQPVPPVSRRGVLVAGAAASALAVAGCATYRPDGSGAGDAPSGAPGGGTAPTALGPATDVPVGGGTVFTEQKVVVTQPQAGTYKAFGATCPHQGCAVGDVSGGTINCPCHGSRFNISDGSVVKGPAKQGLPARQVTTEGGTLTVT